MLRQDIGSCSHLTRAVCDKLESCGIRSIVQLTTTDLEKLSASSGISYRDLLNIKRYLLAKHSSPLVNAAKLFEELMETSAILLCGVGRLDEILDGGFYTGEVVEVVGGTGCGKTKFCETVSLSVASDLRQRVLYLDCSGDFNPFCLNDTLQRRGLNDSDTKSCLENIEVLRIIEPYQLLQELHEIRKSSSGKDSSRLIVVDGIVNLLLSLKRSDAISYVNTLMFALKSVAVEQSLVVLVTILAEPCVDRSVVNFLPNVRLELDALKSVDCDNNSVKEGVKITIAHSSRCASGKFVCVQITDGSLLSMPNRT